MQKNSTEKPLHTLLSIGGSDCIGGAGIQTDIRVAAHYGWHCATAITSLTAQNSHGIKEIKATPSVLLKSQLEAIAEDVIPDAIKIGIVGNLQNIIVISEFLDQMPKEIPVVADTVFVASAGGNLFENEKSSNITKDELIKAYKEQLFPHVSIITPNIEELRLLSPMKESWDCSQAMEHFINQNNPNICVTGIKISDKSLEDIMFYKTGDKFKIARCKHSFIEDCKNLHGTGCLFSSALSINLSYTRSYKTALEETSKFTFNTICNSMEYNLGKSNYGPLNINNYIY